MLGTLRNPPRVVTVRVSKATGLRNTYIESKKHRKDNYKWKVKVKGGKKTLESYTVNDPNGNPVWDFEATIEIADISQPVVIKVTDSDDHHVGQVVIPLIQIPPRSGKPTSNENMRVAELEPTRKVSEVYGSICYWIWAESFYEEGAAEVSSKGSIISSERIRRSASRLSAHVHRHRDKDDGASVTGSTLSMYSTASGKKKHWYNRNPIKHMKEKHGSGASHLGTKHSSELGYSLSQSMNSLFPGEHDGSVLGGHSGNGSDIFGGSNLGNQSVEYQPPAPENPFPRVGSNRRVSRPPPVIPESENKAVVPPRRPSQRAPPKPIDAPVKAASLDFSDEGDENSPLSPGAKPAAFSTPSQDPPSLLSIVPSCGPSDAENEVHIYGKNLTEDIMHHAVLLVDDYTVANYKWSVQEGSWSENSSATHRIVLKIPPRKDDTSGTGQIWIDVETMSHGRLRCPTPFVYQEAEKPPQVQPLPTRIPQSGFARNSSIRLSDNRARGSVRKPEDENILASATPLKAVSPPTGEEPAFVRNSSIRLSDTRTRRSVRAPGGTPVSNPAAHNEIPLSATTRSSGLGSEDSISEASPSVNASTFSADVSTQPKLEVVVEKKEESEPTPTPMQTSGFTRNSSIRLSDSRRRSTRVTKPEATTAEPPKENSIAPASMEPTKAAPEKSASPARPIQSGFERNSSVRISDSRRRAPNQVAPADSTQKLEPPPKGDIDSNTRITSPAQSSFARNSSIRISDSRRRPPKPDATADSKQGFEPATENDVSSTVVTPEKAASPLQVGLVRNSSIRISDARRRSTRIPNSTKAEPISSTDTTSKLEPTATATPPIPTGFVRNSSIRLSDTRNRSMRAAKPLTGIAEATKPEKETPSIKEKEEPPSSDVDEENSPPVKSEPIPVVEIESKKEDVEPVTVHQKDDSDSESSESESESTSEEEEEEKRPDPIGAAVSARNQEFEKPKETAPYQETLKSTAAAEEISDSESTSSDSTDYSLDSARGDSILPTVNENSYSESRAASQPRFVLMEPMEGSTAGGYEICLYGIGLDDSVMQHAQVFVDVYAVRPGDWRVERGQWPQIAPEATHCLHILVPPRMPAGEAWIEVETMNDGRLQCSRPFVFSNRIQPPSKAAITEVAAAAVPDERKFSRRGLGAPAATATAKQPAPTFADFEYSEDLSRKKEKQVEQVTQKLNFAKSGGKGDLKAMKQEIADLYGEISRLKVELQSKSADEMRVARELCMLRTKLLEDGQLKYLERV